MANALIEDIIECPICTDTLKNTRVLPCIHTFCLKCIEQVGKDKKPGDTVSCPCCRQEFQVPIGGLIKLPKNSFIEKLLDVQCDLKPDWANSAIKCAIPGHRKNGTKQAFAIWHCVECRLQMCGGCRSAHLRQGRTVSHHVNLVQKESPCNEHPDKQLDRFCTICKTAVCEECCSSIHRGHEWATFASHVGAQQLEIEQLRLRIAELSSQQNRPERVLTFDAINDVVRNEPLLNPILVVQIARIPVRLHEMKEASDHRHRVAIFVLVAIVILLLAIGWRLRDSPTDSDDYAEDL